MSFSNRQFSHLFLVVDTIFTTTKMKYLFRRCILQVWSLTVAVGCHKVVIAFYIGSQMLSDRARPYLAHGSVFIFAIASPVGITIGILISNFSETSTMFLMSVVLQGLATGTLMFVMFFEVLKPSIEQFRTKQKILRLLFVVIGFTSMLSIQLMVSD